MQACKAIGIVANFLARLQIDPDHLGVIGGTALDFDGAGDRSLVMFGAGRMHLAGRKVFHGNLSQ